SSICLAIEWINAPEKSKTESSLSLTQFTPYFSGYTRWKDYGFFVNKLQEGYEILVKKLPVPSSSTMFKQCEGIFILESGCEFYLGAVKFQLLGDFLEDKDHKTVVKSNKTILKGPGERRRQHFFEGQPRLKIDRITSKREFVEINEKFRLGRPQIAELFGANEDELRQNGISKEHITLTPFMGGQWILEPLPAKPVFVEINESPVILQPGKTIRWVSDDQVEEFQLVIHSAGG
ncbi:MAG: hypothetical protein KAT17_09885, partial [Candidatus Aminicenantes bacterium]|nr:hypothetical protein [Candidatus Aminicenantes bacterium]